VSTVGCNGLVLVGFLYMSKINKLIAVFISIAMLNIPFFFAFIGLLGVEYEGADSSPIYIYYIAFLAVGSFIFYLYASFLKGLYLSEVVVIIVGVMVFFIHFFWYMFGEAVLRIVPDYLLFFIFFGLPGFFSAVTIIKLNLTALLIKFTEVTFLVIASGIIIYTTIPSLTGSKVTNLAGANYQMLSYFSMFTFGMLLVYATLISPQFRLGFTQLPWYKYLSYVVVIACFLGGVVGGGRGALILSIIYILIVLYTMVKNEVKSITRKGVVSFIFKVVIVLIVFLQLVNVFSDISFVLEGLKRATQFIAADGGIDIEKGSSGRDVVYQIAVGYIMDRPLLGYGPFGAMEQTIQAHNIFLDISLQFGLVGLTFFMFFIFYLIIHSVRNWCFISFWVLSLLFYPMIMLMFSGVYLHSSLFVFCITFFIVFRKRDFLNFYREFKH